MTKHEEKKIIWNLLINRLVTIARAKYPLGHYFVKWEYEATGNVYEIQAYQIEGVYKHSGLHHMLQTLMAATQGNCYITGVGINLQMTVGYTFMLSITPRPDGEIRRIP